MAVASTLDTRITEAAATRAVPGMPVLTLRLYLIKGMVISLGVKDVVNLRIRLPLCIDRGGQLGFPTLGPGTLWEQRRGTSTAKVRGYVLCQPPGIWGRRRSCTWSHRP